MSDILCDEFKRGALEAGHEVEKINLGAKKINYCLGCGVCNATGKCVQKDDMAEMIAKVQNADTIIFATPIYYYEMSGQLKTFLDRCNPLYPQENKFKDVYLITSSYDDAKNASDIAANGLGGWVACFEQSRLAGVLTGGGLNEPKDAITNENLLHKAYELGKNV